ncbi:hypothetical protein ACK36T_13135, partial [Aeromonas veronii]
MKMYSNLPIGLHDITEAKKRLTNHIYKTAQLPSNYISERCHGEVYLKLENMQRANSTSKCDTRLCRLTVLFEYLDRLP